MAAAKEEQGGQPPLLHVTQEQEVAAPKPGPRLPVSVARAAAEEGKERTSVPPPPRLHPPAGAQGPRGGQADQSALDSAEEREGEREGDGGERASEPCHLPPSLSPSSLVHMSRIYSSATAGCRGAVSSSGRWAEPGGQGEEPEDEGAEPRPGKGEEGSGGGVAAVQKQVELLHLREREARKRPGQKPKGGAQPAPHALRTSQPTPQLQLPQLRSQRTQPTQPQTPRCFTVTPRAGPPAPKNPEQSTPVGPSPAPALFSLRSSAGVQGRRGNTITITPRKTPAGPGAVSAGAAPAPAPTPTPNGTGTGAGEGGRKRYPTAEEIQVIGGYECLHRSCLVKQSRKQKRVKVCFDETQLEQVCEYPSESAMLACFPCPLQPDPERENVAREGGGRGGRGGGRGRSVHTWECQDNGG
ncbi:hypothetical protein SKAU_G00406010 [Synaphobranchus kaupii]|uniref:Phostensin/Taperin PP1-binding domain-containing protein n=1 Tax=Synaphobranchus kaupii TaxID=118154 RepID=A0A9Q1E9Z3_SYNKA|nr:hypothetical protein SKAU_G00406010 [Synaphobranchus kaupii]